MNSVSAMRELLGRPAATKGMILSAHGSGHLVDDAWAAGAHGYALKSIAVDDLVDGIGKVMAGERYLSPGLAPAKDFVNGPLAALSARERDIFRLLVRGLTTRQMAAQLCISGK